METFFVDRSGVRDDSAVVFIQREVQRERRIFLWAAIDLPY